MRERLVIDASISLAWSLDDETDSRADEALTIVEQSGALVPTLWTFEIANSLTHFVRGSRLDTVRAQTILSALRQLNIVAVSTGSRRLVCGSERARDETRSYDVRCGVSASRRRDLERPRFGPDTQHSLKA